MNEEYIARMEDVLALYEKPLSGREPLVCVDEKPVVLHTDLRPPRPMRPGRNAPRAPEYERATTLHRVKDNLSSDPRKGVGTRCGEKIGGLLWEGFTVNYTPKHGSWRNQAEIETSLFTRQCLGRRRIPSLGELQREARAWNRKMNRDRCHHQLAVYPHKGPAITETTSHGHRPSGIAGTFFFARA